MPRTLKDVKKLPENRLNNLAIRVTRAYAQTRKPQDKIAKDENLTSGAVRGLMDYAIIHALVSRRIAKLTCDAATSNQQARTATRATNSQKYYNDLIEKRNKFIAENMPAETVKNIAEAYADASDNDFGMITDEFNLEDNKVTELIIERAITEKIVSNQIMETIISKCSEFWSTGYCEWLRDMRN